MSMASMTINYCAFIQHTEEKTALLQWLWKSTQNCKYDFKDKLHTLVFVFSPSCFHQPVRLRRSAHCCVWDHSQLSVISSEESTLGWSLALVLSPFTSQTPIPQTCPWFCLSPTWRGPGRHSGCVWWKEAMREGVRDRFRFRTLQWCCKFCKMPWSL